VSFAADNFFDVQVSVINVLHHASLLDRRPDVRQVEINLIAGNADIGVAKAAFYPKLQLNLNTLLASPQSTGVALTMAAALTQPLFQGGKLEGGLENAEGVRVELVSTYRKTIMTAFKEVEDAAAISGNSTLRFQVLSNGVEMARLAYNLSLERYRVGAINYQSLLLPQRTLLTTQNSMI